MQEKIIETKTCRHCGSSFGITDRDLEFYKKVSPIFNGVRYDIPIPKLCPDCRQQRRLSFRNERKLYKRTCDATGKEMISIYSPDKPYKIYEQKEWWSDKWDAKSYGKDFDFSREFFGQLNDLLIETPLQNLVNISSENSDYCALSAFNKNCYLIIGNMSENCMYGIYMKNSVNCLDVYMSIDNAECYETIDVSKSYKVFYSQDSEDCSDSYFLDNCKGCKSCFGCTNLQNAEYSIFNKKHSKEDYEKKIYEILKNPRSIEKFSDEFSRFKRRFPKRAMKMENCNDSVGDNIKNVKGSCHIFDSDGTEGTIENCKYVTLTTQIKDCMDLDDSGMGSELCLEGSTVMQYKVLFSNFILNGSEIFYSNHCHNSNHLFGCIGLRDSSFCILNKKYSQEDYEILVPRIIEHMMKTNEWGEFFPSSISPFGYNETVAQEYFPLDKNEALGKGFRWSDFEPPFPKVNKIIPASKLPENIDEIPDDILNWAIECEATGKPYRIIKQELDFYRKHKLPIPRKHPDQRHLERVQKRNPRKIWQRHCDNCRKQIDTCYSPDRPEIVYCKECYEKTI